MHQLLSNNGTMEALFLPIVTFLFLWAWLWMLLNGPTYIRTMKRAWDEPMALLLWWLISIIFWVLITQTVDSWDGWLNAFFMIVGTVWIIKWLALFISPTSVGKLAACFLNATTVKVAGIVYLLAGIYLATLAF